MAQEAQVVAKRRTIPLKRLHLQPGFCLVQIDKDDDRIGRVVGFPQGPKGSFRLADAESVIDLDEDSREIDIDAEDLGVKLGRLAIMPVGKILGFIAPEPAKEDEKAATPKLVLP